MRMLLLHTDWVEWEPKKKAVELAEKTEKKPVRVKEALVVLTAVESGDGENPKEAARRAVKEILDVFKRVKAKSVVIYPYAHLSPELAKPSVALEILKDMERGVKAAKVKVTRSPFGWYKAFDIKCKGHPLAELSKQIDLGAKPAAVEEESEALRKEKKLKSEWYILTPQGKLTPVGKFSFKGHENLKKFADYEMAGTRAVDKVPPHVKSMKRLELADYESASDPGNLRWYPKGALVKRLLEEHVSNISLRNGAMQVETPIMYDFEHPALKKYIHKFPARQYTIYSDQNRYFLRFSACFGQYMMKHDMSISYRNLPLKLYELTHYSFRREQKGELVGLRRLRSFTMPDMHTLVKDVKQAKEEFMKQYNLSLQWMKDLELPYEIGVRFVKDFYEESKDLAKSLAKTVGKPVLVEMWKERPFYFVMKFECNFVDSMNKASALSTVQIDVENSERFGIKYTDKDNRKKYPLMLHASISGGIDRCVYALLEQAHMEHEAKKNPLLPLWLAPTQVRLCPVSDDFLKAAEKAADELEEAGIRADIDDRVESVGRKIRDAEVEWIPYIVVIGEKEKKSKKLAVRFRETGKVKQMSAKQLVKEVQKGAGNFPQKPLPLPRKLTARPKFVGAL